MLSLASLGMALAFALNQSSADWRRAVLFAAAFAASGLGVFGWRTSPAGQLRWDGQHWHWSGFTSGQPCHLALLADLQRVMLVRLTAAGQTGVWLWLEPTPGHPHWLPLRRAIVSSLPGNGDADTDRLDKGEPV